VYVNDAYRKDLISLNGKWRFQVSLLQLDFK